MTELYLMGKDGERMNVPVDKKEAFEKDGWKVLKKPQDNKTVVVTDQPVVETPVVTDSGGHIRVADEESDEDDADPKPAKRARSKKE